MSVRSGISHNSVDTTENNVEEMIVGDNPGIAMEVSQLDTQLSTAFDNIILRLEDGLDDQIRNLPVFKKRNILELVKGTVETAREKARLSIHLASHSIFEEISMTAEQLRNVLPIASRNSSLMQTLADEMGCEIPEVLGLVKARNLEVDFLKSQMTEREESIKCLQNLNCQLQSQVDDLTARLEVSLGQKQSATRAQGEKNNTTDWSAISKQLLSLNGGKKSNVQNRQIECPVSNAGIAKPRRSISNERSSLYSEPSSRGSTIGESSFLSQNSEVGELSEASHISHAMNGMFSVFKEVFKAQSVADVPKYDGKGSLSDFLRALEMKYPVAVWSDRDRRDVMVNHLTGSARSIYKGLAESVKKGSFAGIVDALKAARRNPCERLKIIDEWDRLRKRSSESVGDFCCRMEDISRKIHPSNEWDFHLASKLYSCLEHWKDSYHLLAALEAREGEIYESVKKVALRLEKTQTARPVREEPFKKFSSFKKRIVADKATTSTHDDRITQKCYTCGGSGHYSGVCPNKSIPRGEPSGPKGQGAVRKGKDGRPPRQALSTFVEEWCGMVRIQRSPVDSGTVAVGKPTLYDATIFGIKVKALIDTGSVISILPAALLKQAKENGFDLDSEVEMVGNGCEHQVFDASGNPMQFLAIVNAEVSVQGADSIRVSMHVQKGKSKTLLLGTNVLEALGIQLRFEPSIDTSRKARNLLEHAKASRRMIIPPGATASIELVGSKKSGERIFWSTDPRITSGVCLLRQGSTEISVANRDSQTWVVNKGEPFGEWSDEWSILPSKSIDMSGGMLDMQKHPVLPKSKRLKVLIEMLQQNRSSGELSKELIGILGKFDETFAITDSELEHTSLVEHDIDVQGHPPIRQKTRPVPYSVRKKVDDMLSDLKDRKIIEESQSPWASPIVLVAKKDGSTRLCIDYREINKVTKKDSYPLPPIDVTLQNLQGKRWFSSLDLASGYWQVPLSEKAREISAFTTTSGLFHFNVLPFGLTNAPAAFQRLMDKVLGNLKGSEVSVYLDDILIATETEQRHLEVLEQTLEAFRKANLKVKPQKCRLMEPSLEFLGHVVDKDGIKTNPDKVGNIRKYPVPRNIAQLRTF
ncbi:zinc knuckle [Ostertagia ostertagi]